MTGSEAIRRIKAEFSPDELAHLRVFAGSALCIHGGKAETADADMLCDSLPVLRRIAERRRLPMSKSATNGADRLEIGDWAEIFYDPGLESTYLTGVSRREVNIGGVRVDSLEALVAWYETAVRVMGRDKDHSNLANARSIQTDRLTE